MAKPRNSTEAIAGRLLSDDAVRAIAGNRIAPNAPTQEGVKPYVSFWRTSGAGGNLLSEASGLSNYIYRVECYAETDDEAEKLLDAVIDRLCGNPRKNIAAWVDRANGIQCCRSASDRDSDILDDGSVVVGQSVSLWFCPQP